MRMLLFAVMLAFCGFPAVAQPYPSRTVRIVVPATPGGAIDLIARTLAEKMTASLGQPVVVENKPGASNNLGTDFVAKSPPDGYTLVICASSHATNKFLFKQMPFDPVKDFEPVVYTHVVPLLLAVNPSVPAKNVSELTAWIKANPDKAIYASSGPGSSLHMAAELYMNMTGTKMHHVPYKGSSAAHPDLLAGRTVDDLRHHHRGAGPRQLRRAARHRGHDREALERDARAADDRRERLPGYDASTWGGILAPAGTPKDVVAKLNAAINAALEDGGRAQAADGRRHRDPGRHARGVRRGDPHRDRQVGPRHQGGGYPARIGQVGSAIHSMVFHRRITIDGNSKWCMTSRRMRSVAANSRPAGSPGARVTRRWNVCSTASIASVISALCGTPAAEAMSRMVASLVSSAAPLVIPLGARASSSSTAAIASSRPRGESSRRIVLQPRLSSASAIVVRSAPTCNGTIVEGLGVTICSSLIGLRYAYPVSMICRLVFPEVSL